MALVAAAPAAQGAAGDPAGGHGRAGSDGGDPLRPRRLGGKQGRNKIPRAAADNAAASRASGSGAAVSVGAGVAAAATALAPPDGQLPPGPAEGGLRPPPQWRVAGPRQEEAPAAEAAGGFVGAPGPSLQQAPAPATGCQPWVLVLGMPKCGTTSLHEAFISAGFSSVHWAIGAGLDSRADKNLRKWGTDAEDRLVACRMLRAAREGRPPLALLPEGVTAVAEMNGLFWDGARAKGYFPQMSLLEGLLEHYPDAYYILNVRDHASWVASVSSHNDMRERLVSADLPGLPSGAGAKDEELVAWVAAHHDRVRAALAARGARLLVFDIDRHGGRELSAFLGRPVAWGHYNVTR